MHKKATSPGRVKEITSIANPIIKDIRLLHKKSHREITNSFLAEGMKLVIDALDQGWALKTLIFASAMRNETHVEQLAARSIAHGSDVLIVPEKTLGIITRRDNPQMVVGVFERRVMHPSSIKATNKDVWIALDRVRDPGNLGTIIRTADAFGAKGVILIGETTDPFASETVRATMGSIFAVPLTRIDEPNFIHFLKKWPGLSIGTHLKGFVDFRTPNYSNDPIILVMGNEQSGLSDPLALACDTLVRIPQKGHADSLNLAVATAISLYEVCREKMPILDEIPL